MVRSRILFVRVSLLFVCTGHKIAFANFIESRTEATSHQMDEIMSTTTNGSGYGQVLQDSNRSLAQVETAKKDKGNHNSLSLNESSALRKYRIPFVISKSALIGIGLAGFCFSLVTALTPLIIVTILMWRPISRTLTAEDYDRVLAFLDQQYALDGDAKVSSSKGEVEAPKEAPDAADAEK